MKSVFNTPPPNFSQKEVQNLVEEHFKIVGSVKSLVSDRDQNFLINSLQGDFIFKISFLISLLINSASFFPSIIILRIILVRTSRKPNF